MESVAQPAAKCNYWADAFTPYRALSDAVALWKKAGKPMDGRAADRTVPVA